MIPRPRPNSFRMGVARNQAQTPRKQSKQANESSGYHFM
jgi:hypothetical protein